MSRLRGSRASLACAVVAMMVTGCSSGGVQVSESEDIHYLVFTASTFASNAMAYRGEFNVDAEGCLYVRFDDHEELYAPAFRPGVTVTAAGVTVETGEFYGYGDLVVAGQASVPELEDPDRGSWPQCMRDRKVFGVVFD